MEDNNSQQLGFQWKGASKKRSKLETETLAGFDEDAVDDLHDCNDDRTETLSKKTKHLVIPLLQNNHQQNNNNNNNNNNSKIASLAPASSDSTLEYQAVQEILNSLKPSNSNASSSTLIIGQLDILNEIGKKAQPLLQANLAPELNGVTDDAERFKIDMSLRPDEISVKSSAYKQIPIEDFGAAMLRGMGWTGYSKEDEEVSKKLNEPLFSRDVHLGLGAKAKPLQLDDKNKFRNNSAKIEQSKSEWLLKAEVKLLNQSVKENDIVWLRVPEYAGLRGYVIATRGVPGLNKISVGLEGSGKEIHIKKSDVIVLTPDELAAKPFSLPILTQNSEEIVEKKFKMEYFGLKNNSQNDILSNNSASASAGNGNGSGGSKSNANDVTIKAENSDLAQYNNTTAVETSRISSSSSSGSSINNNNNDKKSSNVKPHSINAVKPSTKSSYLDKYASIQNPSTSSHSQSQSHSHSSSKHSSLHSEKNKTDKPSSSSSSSRCWLRTGLYVKMVSNKYNKYYLKKGVVQDVYGENLCSIRFTDNQNQVIENIKQKHLETVVPYKNEHCIVLNGAYKGCEAIVLERNIASKSSQTDNVLVQLVDELNIVMEVDMDSVCAFQEELYHS